MRSYTEHDIVISVIRDLSTRHSGILSKRLILSLPLSHIIVSIQVECSNLTIDDTVSILWLSSVG